MHREGESRKKKLRTDNVRHIFTGLSGGLDPRSPLLTSAQQPLPVPSRRSWGRGGVADGGRGEEETGGGGEKMEEGGY